jgi:RNA polymerase sigma-70 factor (ECF subfamily)
MDKYQSIFDTLFEKESDSIFRYCAFRVSDREQALDITQETFLRLWQVLSQGEELRNPRALLFTMAHRLVIDWYRKKKSTSLEMENSYGDDEEEGGGYDPIDEDTAGDWLELKAEGRFLIDKISELPIAYRQAVYLRYIEGMSPPEIAKIMNISANAASVRVNRGIEKLKELTGYGDSENKSKSEVEKSSAKEYRKSSEAKG